MIIYYKYTVIVLNQSFVLFCITLLFLRMARMFAYAPMEASDAICRNSDIFVQSALVTYQYDRFDRSIL